MPAVDIVVYASSDSAAAVSAVWEAAQLAISRVEMWGKFRGELPVYLHDTRQELEQAQGRNHHISGFTRAAAVHILSPAKDDFIRRVLPMFLAHEFTHALVDQMIDDGRAIRARFHEPHFKGWFSEGLSVYTAGQAIWDSNRVRAILREHPGEDVLSAEFTKHPGFERAPYRIGGLVVACLIERYGEDRLRVALNRFREAVNFRDWFGDAYGVSPNTFAEHVLGEIAGGGLCPADLNKRPPRVKWPTTPNSDE